MNSYDKKPYGKDNSYDKSKDSSSVTVKKIKCNNINVNLNGFSGNKIGTAPTSDPGALATQAQAEDEGANGASGNDGRGGDDGRSSGHDSDSRFICINNNDNSGGGGTPDTPDEDACLLCFEEISRCFKNCNHRCSSSRGPLEITDEIASTCRRCQQ